MITCSRMLAWKIPWTEEPVWATVHGVAESQTRLSTALTHKHVYSTELKASHPFHLPTKLVTNPFNSLMILVFPCGRIGTHVEYSFSTKEWWEQKLFRESNLWVILWILIWDFRIKMLLSSMFYIKSLWKNWHGVSSLWLLNDTRHDGR